MTRCNNVPMLLCTGDLQIADELEQAGIYHLRKPFKLNAVTEWVEEQLYSSARPAFMSLPAASAQRMLALAPEFFAR